MSIDFVFGQFVVQCLSCGQFVVRFLLQLLDSSLSDGCCIGSRDSSSSVKSLIFVNRRKFVCGRCITIFVNSSLDSSSSDVGYSALIVASSSAVDFSQSVPYRCGLQVRL